MAKVDCVSIWLAILIAGCCSMPATDVPVNQNFATHVNSTTTATPELFAYPAEQSEIESKQNARNRTPIYIPKRCAENEILYPGDHETDWVCDCKPTFVFHPATHQCYQLHTKGYCKENEILYLEPNGRNPTCQLNQCPGEKVLFMKECVELNKPHALCHLAKIELVVGINEATNELECVNVSSVPLNRTMIYGRE